MNEYLKQIADALTQLVSDQSAYLAFARERDDEHLRIQRAHLEIAQQQEARWQAQDEAKVQDE